VRRVCPLRISAASSAGFGETPHQYLLTRRIERAAALLRNTDRSVADICFTVGLRSVGSFTTTFGRLLERPYGIDAGFRDPSGNQIRMVQAR
jgi:methylphosphotriester-DNA--protein-cysteine methyltransferase